MKNTGGTQVLGGISASPKKYRNLYDEPWCEFVFQMLPKRQEYC